MDNETIDVHKSVLCAVSDYFRAMLSRVWYEGENVEVSHIQYIRADVVKTMVKYFHGEKKYVFIAKHIKEYVDIVELW